MPLMYQYRTALAWDSQAGDADELVTSAGHGQIESDADHTYLPIVDDRWWDTGLVVLGSQRPFEFALGVEQGSPSWPAPGEDNTPGQTLLGRLGVAPVAGVRVGVSGAYGTWMPEWFSWALPANRSVSDYHEVLTMADLELARDRFELRAEGYAKRWETATTGDLDVRGGYAEAKLGVGTGAWLAARGEVMRFSDITTSAGDRPWDDDVDRIEAGAGYRASRDVSLKLAGQRTVRHPFGAGDLTTDLVSLAASIRF